MNDETERVLILGLTNPLIIMLNVIFRRSQNGYDFFMYIISTL